MADHQEQGENSTFIEEGGDGPSGLPNQTVINATIGLQIVFIVTGAIGNTLVLYIYGRRQDRLTSTLSILTLAGKDLFCCAVVFPYLIIVEALRFYTKYDFFCRLFHFLVVSHLPFTVLAMTAIAVDRCACVCHNYMHVTNLKRARIVILVVLLATVAISVAPTLGFGVYMKTRQFLQESSSATFLNKTFIPSENVQTDLTYTGWCHANEVILTIEDLVKYSIFYRFMFVAPLVCTALLYIGIFAFVQYAKWKDQRSQLELQLNSTGMSAGETTHETPDGASTNSRQDEEERERNYREQIQLSSMMFTVTTVFYVVFFPTWLMAHRVVAFNVIIFYLYLIHNASNPVVYVCMDGSFRNELKNLLHRSWTRISH